MKRNMGLKWLATLSVIVLSLIHSGCDNNSPATVATQSNVVGIPKTNDPALRVALLEAKQSEINSQLEILGTVSSCVDKSSKVINNELLPKPSQATLSSSQQSLQSCLELYLPLHAELKNSNNQTLLPLISAIYSAPILPGYVDYLQDYPESGIVNDITLLITEESLRDQQGLTDSSEISIGFEVIAFLLFGEQRYDSSLPPRLAIDFIKSTPESSTQSHADRRQQYLRSAMALLQKDLASMSKALALPLEQ